MKTNDELTVERLRTDPESGRRGSGPRWRALAVVIVCYRSDCAISQRDLADRAGDEAASGRPLGARRGYSRIETIMRISGQLGTDFTIDVRPAGAPAKNLTTKRAQADGDVGAFRGYDADLLVTAD